MKSHQTERSINAPSKCTLYKQHEANFIYWKDFMLSEVVKVEVRILYLFCTHGGLAVLVSFGQIAIAPSVVRLEF